MRDTVVAMIVAAATFSAVSGGIVGVGLATNERIEPVHFATIAPVSGANAATPGAPGAQRAALAALPASPSF